MGAMGKNGVRTSDRQECQQILDTFFKFGSEVDTARQYGEGTTEEVKSTLLSCHTSLILWKYSFFLNWICEMLRLIPS